MHIHTQTQAKKHWENFLCKRWFTWSTQTEGMTSRYTWEGGWKVNHFQHFSLFLSRCSDSARPVKQPSQKGHSAVHDHNAPIDVQWKINANYFTLIFSGKIKRGVGAGEESVTASNKTQLWLHKVRYKWDATDDGRWFDQRCKVENLKHPLALFAASSVPCSCVCVVWVSLFLSLFLFIYVSLLSIAFERLVSPEGSSGVPCRHWKLQNVFHRG